MFDDTGMTNSDRIADGSTIQIRGGGTLRDIGNASTSSSETMGLEVMGPESGGPLTIQLTPGGARQWTLGSSISAAGEFTRTQGATVVFTGMSGAGNQILVAHRRWPCRPAHNRLSRATGSAVPGLGSDRKHFRLGGVHRDVRQYVRSYGLCRLHVVAGWQHHRERQYHEFSVHLQHADGQFPAHYFNIEQRQPQSRRKHADADHGRAAVYGRRKLRHHQRRHRAPAGGEMIVHVLANTLTTPALAVGTGGLTKSGAGKLLLGAGSTLGGALTVGQGTLDLNAISGTVTSLLGAGTITNNGGNDRDAYGGGAQRDEFIQWRDSGWNPGRRTRQERCGQHDPCRDQLYLQRAGDDPGAASVEPRRSRRQWVRNRGPGRQPVHVRRGPDLDDLRWTLLVNAYMPPAIRLRLLWRRSRTIWP